MDKALLDKERANPSVGPILSSPALPSITASFLSREIPSISNGSRCLAFRYRFTTGVLLRNDGSSPSAKKRDLSVPAAGLVGKVKQTVWTGRFAPRSGQLGLPGGG